jgi:hypothetical protein
MFSPSRETQLVHDLAESSNDTCSRNDVRALPHVDTLKRASSDAEKGHVKRAKTIEDEDSEGEEDNDEIEDEDYDYEEENEDDAVSNKVCCACHESKPLDDFHRWARSQDGRRARCKACISVQTKVYKKRTLQNSDHFVTEMISNVMFHDKAKSRSFDLDEACIKELYAKQAGRCHATLVPIFLKQGAWQASIDRIDNTNGHTRDNVELSALEVNNRIHWTKELTRDLISKSSEEFGDFQAVVDEVLATHTRESGILYRKWPVIARDGKSFVFCHGCEIEKPVEEFYKQRSGGCKACTSKRCAEYTNTWRGVFTQLLSRSKSCTKTRNSKGRDHDHDIDLQHVVELFVRQQGRCFYSRAPLVMEGPFKMSLERIDITKGYIKGNVCLIVMMMNSTDRLGETGWSRSKFLFMVREFQTHDVHDT